MAGTARGASQAQSRTDTRGRWERGGDKTREEILGQKWKTFFFVPLFSDVETTQCEEEDRSRQDTDRQTDEQLILHQI